MVANAGFQQFAPPHQARSPHSRLEDHTPRAEGRSPRPQPPLGNAHVTGGQNPYGFVSAAYRHPGRVILGVEKPRGFVEVLRTMTWLLAIGMAGAAAFSVVSAKMARPQLTTLEHRL